MTRIIQKHSTLTARLFPRLMLVVLVAGVLLLAVTAVQAATPEQSCKSGKNKTAGKYAACRENAEAKRAAGGETSKYNEAIDKCESKFSTAWDKLEAKALAASASCPADDTVIKDQTNAYTDRVAAQVAGARFKDNLDGTVTDHQTGLQWEKKTDDGSVHDKDITHNWSIGGSSPDGTAFTSFLTTLNGGATGVGDCVSLNASTIMGGFAGYCDWRLPSIAELRTILLAPYPYCTMNPCIDAIFGPTVADRYWSATTYTAGSFLAWHVNFLSGYVGDNNKGVTLRVRAVRGGS